MQEKAGRGKQISEGPWKRELWAEELGLGNVKGWGSWGRGQDQDPDMAQEWNSSLGRRQDRPQDR